MSMKKNTFLIILTCITVACIIIGSGVHLGFNTRPIRRAGRTFSRVFRLGIDAFENDDYGSGDFEIDFDDDIEETDGKFSHTESKELNKFDSIRIEGNVMAVTIGQGKGYSATVWYSSRKLVPSYEISGGRLTINQPYYSRKLTTNGKCRVDITVPAGVELDSVTLNVDVGAVEIKDVAIKDAEIKTDVGAVSVEEVDFEELSINTDVGAVMVELNNPVSEYNIDVKSDVGEVVVDGKKAKRHKYRGDGTTRKRIKINADVGGIEIK